MAEALVEIKDISKSFGRFTALRNVNLTLIPGEFVTIFGRNGAGKTTLLRMIATLMRPSAGTINLNGIDLKKQPGDIRQKIGFISHSTFLYSNLTAVENLKFFGKMYNVADLDDKIEKRIREVGLFGRERDNVGTYSRGMQQRLSIARAILHNPNILLLDEPSTGLDQHATDILKRLLMELHTKDRAIIMTTHDIEIGLDLSDKFVILERGKITFSGKSKEYDQTGFRKIYTKFVGG